MRWGIVLALVVLVGAGAFAAGRFLGAAGREGGATSDPSTAARVFRPDAVGTIGWLEPDPKVLTLAAPTSAAEAALIGELLVEEGDWVEAGTVLARLDSYDRRVAAIAESEARVGVADATVASVRAGAKPSDIASQQAVVERAAATYQLAVDENRRQQELLRTGAVTPESAQQQMTRMLESEQTLEEARHRLESLRTVRPEDIAIAEAELAAARATVARLKAELDLAMIVAPSDGQILDIHARQGESIGSEGFADFGNTRRMCAIAETFEGDVPRVRIGQRARVEVDSLERPLTGYVIQIGRKVGRRTVLDNDPVKDTDARVVEVRILLDEPDAALVAGLSYARVRIVIDLASDAEESAPIGDAEPSRDGAAGE
ncbi:MAG TPA: hemolysin D [Planctomycetaceae bacterium]|nr:hemolysin D [Planctomycetaceae bacterium]HRF01410.1 HlyD family efflux transporter periplasmic adaptor subunit [Pirellulaceae bacterium]